MSKARIIRQWVRISFGLLVFSLGVRLIIFASIGLAPWDCFGMGIAAHTPLNYGLAMTAASVIILFTDLLLHEQFGYGTIIDALFAGLGKRLSQAHIGTVQIILWSLVTVVGWLLGGPVGVGTLLSAFGAGAVMQAVYQLLRFEPRDVAHHDVIEITNHLTS